MQQPVDKMFVKCKKKVPTESMFPRPVVADSINFGIAFILYDTDRFFHKT